MAKIKPTATATEPTDKPKCPITRETFVAKAPVLTLDVGEDGKPVAKFLCGPKDFSTGSFGWGASEKMTLIIDGKPVKVQASINLTVVGSKELPK